MNVKKIDTKYVSEISTLSSQAEQNAAMNWMSDQSSEIKIMILERHGSLIRQRHQPGVKVTPVLSFSLLLLAVKQTRIDLSSLSFKRDLSIAQTEQISRLRIDNRKPRKAKGSKKLNRLRKEFFLLIFLLRDEHNYSWSQIVTFLWTNYQFDVSKAYLQTAFKKLSAEVSHGN